MTEIPQVLLVDDDPDWLDINLQKLMDNTYQLHGAKSIKQASNLILSKDFDVVATDVRLLGDDLGGVNLLNFIKRERPDIPVIVFSAWGSLEFVNQVLRGGAYDFLAKPLEPDAAKLSIKKAILNRQELISWRKDRNKQLEGKLIFPEKFLYVSAPMREVISQVAKQTEQTDNVLILGQRGTGKGLLAEALHSGSGRGAFVLVNCSSLSAGMLERSLFGYTDASATWQPGYLQITIGGTLVLDDVSALSKSLQLMLLQALKTKTINANSNGDLISLDVRIVSLDSPEFEDHVHDGLFDPVLYQILSQAKIHVPPLRERYDERFNDTAHLAEYFIKKHGSEPYPVLSTEARDALMGYSFPNNVRELQVFIRRAVALSIDNVITLDHLPQFLRKKHTTGLGVDHSNALSDSVACPHSHFECDQLQTIRQGFADKKRVYIRVDQTASVDVALNIQEGVERAGFTLQQQVNSTGKRVEQCRFCMPIQMSHYAVVDLSSNKEGILYEVGLLHTLGIPTLLLMSKSSQPAQAINEARIVHYASPSEISYLVERWLREQNPPTEN